MNPICLTINGMPHPRTKNKGDTGSAHNWRNSILEQSASTTPIKGECFLKLVFNLPPEYYSSELPHGPDLGDLLRFLLEGLRETVFRNYDESSITHLQASKERVDAREKASAYLEIYPVEGASLAARAVALGVPAAWAVELSDPREDIYTLADGEPVDGSR